MRIKSIPVVDLFAGPGGLGEGFSSAPNDVFRIVVSAEKDSFAHATLRLRAYYRLLLRKRPDLLSVYFDFCNGVQELPWNPQTCDLWEEAGMEARQIELGTKSGNTELDSAIANRVDPNKPWVLIGGPPCQAYSVMGRSRNRGTSGYVAEKDPRHFLYREYLRILKKYRPSIFVMENVKGILSSKVHGEHIFHSILRDLANPDCTSSTPWGYRIFSLVSNVEFRRGCSPLTIDPRDFVIKSEEYGIPQCRHRVVLLGVREDILVENVKPLRKSESCVTLAEVISDLPHLRSKLSKQPDSAVQWAAFVRQSMQTLINNTDDERLAAQLRKSMAKVAKSKLTGGLRMPKRGVQAAPQNMLQSWFLHNSPDVWLNHDVRGHMGSDLLRYAFAASYAKTYGCSPKADKFNIKGLRPDHDNWDTGDFSDRFRVQVSDRPGTTVTSHISKDGHYYIHPDPSQCRSFTVREAARIQTFPDNYFFQGNRTQQFHQVGNAVPPYLAKQIAESVLDVLVKSLLIR